MAMALWPVLPSEPGRSMMSPRVSYRYAWQQVISGLGRRRSSTVYCIKIKDSHQVSSGRIFKNAESDRWSTTGFILIMDSIKVIALTLATLATASSAQASFDASTHLHIRQNTNETACAVVPDQNTYVDSQTLSQCGNASLFSTWRPRARFIAPEGWMNGELPNRLAGETLEVESHLP